MEKYGAETYGEHVAEIAMRRRIVRCNRREPPEHDLRLG